VGYLNQAIKRISVIDWGSLGEKEAMSQSYLCREYLRRATKFLRDYPGTCVPPFIMISNSITEPQENIEMIEMLNEINNSYHRALSLRVILNYALLLMKQIQLLWITRICLNQQ